MSQERNAEEMRADYVAKMGQDLGELFCAVSTELTWVHWRWEQLRILFADKASRVDLLNECAPHFFYIVQRVLFEDALLGIARLVGPPASCGKPNLTVQRFPSLVKSDLQGEVQELVKRAKGSTGFAFDWRNRQIAHLDLDLNLGRDAHPLAPATRTKVENSLSALRDILNRIELEYCGTSTAYTHVFAAGDAETLLYVLRDGLQHQRDKYERLKRGEIDAKDLEPGEEI